MIRYAAIAKVLAPLAACAKSEGCIELSEHLRLWMVSAEEKYVTESNDDYLLGRRVFYVDVVDGMVVGKSTGSNYNGIKNDPGKKQQGQALFKKPQNFPS